MDLWLGLACFLLLSTHVKKLLRIWQYVKEMAQSFGKSQEGMRNPSFHSKLISNQICPALLG